MPTHALIVPAAVNWCRNTDVIFKMLCELPHGLFPPALLG
jgi:hypothetical protein